jgi:hypothetical protein
MDEVPAGTQRRTDPPEDDPDGDRRHCRRVGVDLPARVVRWTEAPLPDPRTVNISRAGALVSFPQESVPLRPRDCVLLSIVLPQGAVHGRASVTRVARGLDGRSYAAAVFTDLHPDDEDRLDAYVEERRSEADAAD